MQNLKMRIDGMSCGHCVRSVSQALTALDGVHVDAVDVGSAEVSFDPAATSPERIRAALGEAGYRVRDLATTSS